MSAIVEAVGKLEQLVLDLGDELEAREGTTRGVLTIETSIGYIARAAHLLSELPELSPRLRAEVLALQVVCVCGHDRGCHLYDPPHGCEDCEQDQETYGVIEGCSAFRAADTEAPPAATPTDIDELAGVAAEVSVALRRSVVAKRDA